MPVFAENDAWGLEEAHQAALRHYGNKHSGVQEIPEAERTASAPTSKMTLTEGTGMPVPKRKAVLQSTPSTRSPSPVPSPHASSPDSRVKRIYRTADGRFDTSTIQNGNADTLKGYGRPAAAPVQAPSRPASPSLSRPEMTRTNSNVSNSSWRTRRDSVSKLARRMSDTFKEAFNIVKMDKIERRDFVRGKYEETEAESKRNSEQSVVVARDSVLQDSVKSPIERKGKFLEHLDEPVEEPEVLTKPKPANLSKGEKFAIGVSKAVDPLKPRGRSATNDSDMSFGMTDLAPAGALQECAECSRPTYEYLINGLCKECHAIEVKVAKQRGTSEGTSKSR